MSNTIENNNTILVPYDFSEIAENALGHAVKIAKIYNNKITLLHIVEDNLLESVFGSNPLKEGLVREALENKLDKIINDIKTREHIEINKLVEEGRVHRTIVRIANEGHYDSIVMGSNGAAGMEQIIGSNASRVIRFSEQPVVVVKEKPIGNGYEKIVLPIDTTYETRQKVTWAIHLAKKFNSTIHIIFENVEDEYTRSKLFASVNSVQDILDKNNVKYVVKSLDEEKYPDNFAKETLTYANEIDADLIMIMTQQEVGFSELIIGSYAQQIVNQSQRIPVMCINPKEGGYTLAYGSFFE
ncbi:MAG: universal stress protein [Bacteroidetes bacterium]|nr:universal stress protein [Bacteroidota bacterium]